MVLRFFLVIAKKFLYGKICIRKYKYNKRKIGEKMDFKEFEGFKRINNTKNLTVEQLVELLDAYKEILGEISYKFDLDNADIYIDFEGRYGAEIRIDKPKEQIIIERKLDENCIKDSGSVIENEKDLSEVKADRLIEQIYDLINDYMDDGIITEHITKAQKVLYMSEKEMSVKGILYLGNVFEVKDDTKELFEIKESPITKSYSVENCLTQRKEIAINYSDYKNQTYSIVLQPFENLVFKKDPSTIKTRFIAKTSTKEYKISGDYTENHFLIELDEVVIGAIDCSNPHFKTEYRIEINNLDEMSKIVAIAVMLDTYCRKEEDINYKRELITKVKKKIIL